MLTHIHLTFLSTALIWKRVSAVYGIHAYFVFEIVNQYNTDFLSLKFLISVIKDKEISG